MKNKKFYRLIFFLPIFFLLLPNSYAYEGTFPNWFTPARAKLELFDYFVAATNKIEDFGYYKIKEIQLNPIKYDWGLHCLKGIIFFDEPSCNDGKFEVMWCAGSPCNQDTCIPLWKTFSKCTSSAEN